MCSSSLHPQCCRTHPERSPTLSTGSLYTPHAVSHPCYALDGEWYSPQVDSPLKLGNCADDVAVAFPLALADPALDAEPLALDVGVNDTLSPTEAVDVSAGGVKDAAAST